MRRSTSAGSRSRRCGKARRGWRRSSTGSISPTVRGRRKRALSVRLNITESEPQKVRLGVRLPITGGHVADPASAEMRKIDPELIAVAQSFVNEHRGEALAKARAIVERHRQDQTEDADFWAAIAEIVEAILLRAS